MYICDMEVSLRRLFVALDLFLLTRGRSAHLLPRRCAASRMLCSSSGFTAGAAFVKSLQGAYRLARFEIFASVVCQVVQGEGVRGLGSGCLVYGQG